MNKRSSIPDSWRVSKTASADNEMIAGATVGAGAGFGLGTLASYIPGVTRDKAQTLGTALGTVAGTGFGYNGGFGKLVHKVNNGPNSVQTDIPTNYGPDSKTPVQLQTPLKVAGLANIALRQGSRIAGAVVGAGAGALSSSDPDESQRNMFIGALAGAGVGGMKTMRSSFNNNVLKPTIRGADGAMEGIAKNIPNPPATSNPATAMRATQAPQAAQTVQAPKYTPSAQAASMPSRAPSMQGQVASNGQPNMISRLKNSVGNIFNNGNAQTQNPTVIRSMPLKPSNNSTRPNVQPQSQKANTVNPGTSGSNPATQFRSQSGRTQQRQPMVANVPPQVQHNKSFAISGM